MTGSASKRWKGTAAWLLCLLLVFVAADPPHCDLCDATLVAVTAVSQTAIANHLHSAPSDDCNGVCACCDFHGMPADYRVVTAAETVAGMRPVEPLSTPSSVRLSLFRPPRMLSL